MLINKTNKKFLIYFLIMSFIFILFFSYFVVLAQDPPPATSGQNPVALVNPIQVESIEILIKRVLEGIVKLGMPLIALAIIYSGFLYVSAVGNPEKIKTAHNALLYTLLGAVILLGAWGLSEIIVETVQGL